MQISHVIRGEDHLSNTPKHILLFRALGAPTPVFAHLPLILNPDRTKMSKRKSQTAITDYIAQGFIREALVNYLALLGWSSGTEEELFTLDELVERFDLAARAQGGRGVRPRATRVAQRPVDPPPVARRAGRAVAAVPRGGRGGGSHRPDAVATTRSARSCPMVRERLPLLGAIGELVGFLFLDQVTVDPALLVPKRWDAATTVEALRAARTVIADVGAVSFEADELEPPLRRLAEERGWKAGDLFMAIRVASTGRTATPPLFDTLVALGRDRSLERLDRAIDVLDAVACVPRR